MWLGIWRSAGMNFMLQVGQAEFPYHIIQCPFGIILYSDMAISCAVYLFNTKTLNILEHFDY